MRIGLKLTVAFLAIASLVGAVGYIAADADREVANQMERLSRSAVVKADTTEMLDALYAAQLAAHALVALLPLSPSRQAAVESMSRRPAGERGKIPVVLESDGPRPRHLEIEILDDPRCEDGRILFLYDISPLVDLRRQLDNRAAFHNILGISRATLYRRLRELGMGEVDS
ncbi:MAG: hypothetical protein GXY83_29995 [Rhodopirellula sp.]|nr:hypothetical protein [Rhodopirellula sp.]